MKMLAVFTFATVAYVRTCLLLNRQVHQRYAGVLMNAEDDEVDG